MIIVTAVPDPIQKALRERKSNWNKKMVTPFVDDLLHLKWLMNGKPSKFNKERSFITHPIPADPATILGVLAGDFQRIVEEGNAIIRDQINYSANRRKKQPKQPEAPSQLNLPNVSLAPQPQTNPNQLNLPGITTSAINDGFVVEGSNIFTRFLSELKGPRFGESTEAQKRRNRVSLLKKTNKLYKKCAAFQADIVSTGDEFDGLAEALDAFTEIETEFKDMRNAVASFGEILTGVEPTKKPESTDGGEPPPAPKGTNTPPAVPPPAVPPPEGRNDQALTNQADKLIEEWSRVGSLLLDVPPNLRSDMEILIENYINNDASVRPILGGVIIRKNREILDYYNKKLSSEGKQKVISLSDYILSSRSLFNNYELETIADHNVKRWTGKLYHQLRTKQLSAYRLAAYRSAADLRKELNEIMDMLEKDFDPKSLLSKMDAIIIKGGAIYNIKNIIKSMSTSIEVSLQNKHYDDPLKEKKRTKLLEAIQKRKRTMFTQDITRHLV